MVNVLKYLKIKNLNMFSLHWTRVVGFPKRTEQNNANMKRPDGALMRTCCVFGSVLVCRRCWLMSPTFRKWRRCWTVSFLSPFHCYYNKQIWLCLSNDRLCLYRSKNDEVLDSPSARFLDQCFSGATLAAVAHCCSSPFFAGSWQGISRGGHGSSKLLCRTLWRMLGRRNGSLS